MRIIVLTLILLACLVATAAAQESAAASGSNDTVRVPAAVGTIVRGYMQDYNGQPAVGELQLAGSSPDDLFTYWVASDGRYYYGFDVYREVWRPSPAEYIPATLTFQGGRLSGWLRSFGGFVDRDFFFGLDGAVYQRFYVEVDGAVVYTYFIHAATGQRSDSLELLNQVVTQPGLAPIVLAQQAAQQEQYLASFPERAEDYPHWRVYGNTLPIELPSLVSWGATATGLDRELPANQPNLLELIEEEVGPLDGEGEATETTPLPQDPAAPAEPAEPAESTESGAE